MPSPLHAFALTLRSTASPTVSRYWNNFHYADKHSVSIIRRICSLHHTYLWSLNRRPALLHETQTARWHDHCSKSLLLMWTINNREHCWRKKKLPLILSSKTWTRNAVPVGPTPPYKNDEIVPGPYFLHPQSFNTLFEDQQKWPWSFLSLSLACLPLSSSQQLSLVHGDNVNCVSVSCRNATNNHFATFQAAVLAGRALRLATLRFRQPKVHILTCKNYRRLVLLDILALSTTITIHSVFLFVTSLLLTT